MLPFTVHDMADSEALRPVLSTQVSLACVNAGSTADPGCEIRPTEAYLS